MRTGIDANRSKDGEFDDMHLQVNEMTKRRSASIPELTLILHRYAMLLQRLVERLHRPWERWRTHVATAAVVSVISWALAAYLWAR